MSVGAPVESTPVPTADKVTTSPAWSPTSLVSLVIPLVTIVGLIVLLALHDIDQATGIGLIGGLAGLHGGVVAANSGR